MDQSDRRRRARSGEREYRIRLPASVDAQQLLLALGAVQAVEKHVPTLREFAPLFVTKYAKANRQKPSGIGSKESHFRIHLVPLFGEVHLNAFTQEQIQDLKAHLEKRNPKTVNNVLSTLSMTLKTAVEWGVISEMPVRIETLAVQEPDFVFYDKDEYERLKIGAMCAGPAVHALVTLGGDCGLRKGEIVALEWRDLDFDRELVHIQRSETKGQVTAPKGGRDRFVPMTTEAREALKRVAHQSGPRVFYRGDGETMGKHRLTTPMAQAQRAAGFEATGGLHILRHTYCSHLAMAGVPAKAIQELAGHVSLRTTERYMHLAPGEKGRAIEQLERYRHQ